MLPPYSLSKAGIMYVLFGLVMFVSPARALLTANHIYVGPAVMCANIR